MGLVPWSDFPSVQWSGAGTPVFTDWPASSSGAETREVARIKRWIRQNKIALQLNTENKRSKKCSSSVD